MSKPRIYSGGRRGKAILKWLFPALLLLAALLAALFFLLRSWTVYDEAGAHIRPPWVVSRMTENGEAAKSKNR